MAFLCSDGTLHAARGSCPATPLEQGPATPSVLKGRPGVWSPESQRDSVLQPRVGSQSLPWEGITKRRHQPQRGLRRATTLEVPCMYDATPVGHTRQLKRLRSNGY